MPQKRAAPSRGGPSPRDTRTHPSGQETPAPACSGGFRPDRLPSQMDGGGGPPAPESPGRSLTRQYSSMGFSLLTATSRMWLLRKRILPGREMLVSQVVPGKAATGTWDPYRLSPLSLGHHFCSLSKQSPLSEGRRHPNLRAQALSGKGGTLEAAILSRAPCVGQMTGSIPDMGAAPDRPHK